MTPKGYGQKDLSRRSSW